MIKSLAVCVLLIVLPGQLLKPESTPRKLFILGDSTAAEYDPSRHPFVGWGQVFQDFLNPDSILIQNMAISGRSSKSFYFDTWGWPFARPMVNSGDIVFIQFGHNDAKSDTSLHTDPYTTYKAYLKKYVDESRAKGAFPVLLTPIHQNVWSSDSLSILTTHGDYPAAMRQLAMEENVPLLDLTDRTEMLYESYGKFRTTWELFFNLRPELYRTYLNGKTDNTHLQESGSYEICNLIADEIKLHGSDSAISKLLPALLPMQKLNVAVEPVHGGYLKGPRYFSLGNQHRIEAVPAPGYEFRYWTLGLKLTLTSKNSNFAFSLDSGDGSLRLAHFMVKGASTSYSTPTDTMHLTNTITTDTIVGIHAGEADSTLKIYPSPADQVLTIEYPGGIQAIRLWDMTGKQVYQAQGSRQQHVSIETHTFPPGIYWVALRSEKGMFNRKVVIRR